MQNTVLGSRWENQTYTNKSLTRELLDSEDYVLWVSVFVRVSSAQQVFVEWMNDVTKHFTETNHTNKDFLSPINVLATCIGFSQDKILALTELTTNKGVVCGGNNHENRNTGSSSLWCVKREGKQWHRKWVLEVLWREWQRGLLWEGEFTATHWRMKRASQWRCGRKVDEDSMGDNALGLIEQQKRVRLYWRAQSGGWARGQLCRTLEARVSFSSV